ncbi:U1 small nuclear ribonucleoprotein 70 kDa, partial [Ananas comosus]
MGDYNNAMMRNADAAVQARTKAQNRVNVLQLKLIGQSHPTGLTTNLLKLFEPRPPLEYKPPIEKRKCPPYTGMAQFVSHFAEPGDPEYAPPVEKAETRAEKKARIHKIRLEKGAAKAAEELTKYDPQNDPNVTGDPYKTLFVARLNYETSEHRIKREFEAYGPIKRVSIEQKSRWQIRFAYNFVVPILFISFVVGASSVAAAISKLMEGKDNKRVLVDVDVVELFLIGALEGWWWTWIEQDGSEQIDQKNSSRDREKSRERGKDRDREHERSRERSHDRTRDRDPREDKPHHRERERTRDRDRERDRGRDRDRDRDRGRERDKERDRGRESRDYDRDREHRDHDRHRDRGRDRERDYERVSYERDHGGNVHERDAGYDIVEPKHERDFDQVGHGHGHDYKMYDHGGPDDSGHESRRHEHEYYDDEPYKGDARDYHGQFNHDEPRE